MDRRKDVFTVCERIGLGFIVVCCLLTYVAAFFVLTH